MLRLGRQSRNQPKLFSNSELNDLTSTLTHKCQFQRVSNNDNCDTITTRLMYSLQRRSLCRLGLDDGIE